MLWHHKPLISILLRSQLKIMIRSFMLLFFAALSFSLDAQVQFESDSFVELFEGQESGKPVFIDVYTTWCGPCKQMDKTTFQDEAVGRLLNEKFVSVKWDADDIKYKADARRLGVVAYPTYLFLDPSGKLIASPSGYKDAKSFMNLTQSIIDFIADNPLEGLDLSTLSLDESNDILKQLADFNIEEKTVLTDQMINQLKDSNDSLWTDYAEVLAINSHEDMDVDILQKLIDAQEPINQLNFKSIQTRSKVNNALSDVLRYKFRAALKSDDYPVYRRISRMRTELNSSFSNNQTPDSEITKELQTDRLDYYEYHRMADHYKPLADSMITQYIMPHSPEFINDIDKQDAESQSAWRNAFSDNDQNTVDTSSIHFFKDQHFNGIKIADRLNDIAQNIIKIYDDPDSHKDALRYALLAYDYAALPKYLVTQAHIQVELDDKKAAIATLQEGKAHQFFKEAQAQINTMLYKLGIEE